MQGDFHLPIYRMSGQASHEELKKQLSSAGNNLIWNSVDYRELASYRNFVLVMGNEGQGN